MGYPWRIGFCALALTTGLAAIGLSAWAQDAPPPDAEREAAEYRACLDLVAQDPNEALAGAIAWERQSGGDAARHCQALALIGIGEIEDGALALERLAADQPRRALARAVDLLAQAAQAWIAAGKPDRALADQNRGLELMPENLDLLIDRALNYGGAGQYAEALADLDRALKLAPPDAEILAYRASALIHLDRLDEARSDLDRALALDPKEAKAWLELGRLEKARGDKPAARRALLQAALLAPATPVAEAAQALIAELDVAIQP